MANWSGEMQHLAALSCDPSRLPEMAPMLEEETKVFWCREMLVDMFTNRKYVIVWSFYDLRCFWDSFYIEDACVVLCKDNDGSPTAASFRTHLSLNSINPPYSPMVEPKHAFYPKFLVTFSRSPLMLYAFKFSETTTFQANLEFTSLNTISTAHDTVTTCPPLSIGMCCLPLFLYSFESRIVSTSSFYKRWFFNDFETSVFEIRLGFLMSSCFLLPIQENPEISAQQSTESAASLQGFSCSTVCCIYILNVHTHTCISIMLYCEFSRKHA